MSFPFSFVKPKKIQSKMQNYKKLAEKSNSFKTNKSVTNITKCQIVYELQTIEIFGPVI